MPFELFLALRYLVARRKQAFLSLISVISTIGVAVGVMALIIALALMTGLQGELRDRIVGASPHIYVWKVGDGLTDLRGDIARIRQVPRVTGASPILLGKALVTAGEQQAFITVKGIEPSTEGEVTDVGARMTKGSLAALASQPEEGLAGIAIGQALADQLRVDVGDTVTLMTPEGPLSPFGPTMGSRRLEVVGVYSLGLYEFDAAYGFVSLPTAQRLLARDRPDFIQVRVDDMYAAPAVAADLVKRLGGLYVTQDWAQMNQSLFSALWLEKMAISITIGLIVMVAALNIVASLVLLVMEKSRDIAILKTMGAGARSITAVFMLQGLIIGAIGTLVGATSGLLVTWVLDRYKLIRVPMDVYQVAYVPFKVQADDFVLVVLAALLVCFLATIYPSRQASRLDPAQALRYQ
ncbi:ABC transporter permease [Luteitalea sp. TBR-22]|uniref:lipoprotein-releasing ABC transporter permease subunit n=1 Tax=Luteitalea sp. TBR-22 TaxID=2802971 RepID=UPI001AF0404F|nr:lipoprotein-releasing ABC transporter permease subunit [Luteitalea sp. TBR-22]BCS34140.1 ABC transporter permease [Luteitalea sp. TBR-22]